MIRKKTYQNGFTHLLLINCEKFSSGILYHMLCIFSSRITKDPLKDGEKKVVLVLLIFFFHLYLFIQLFQMWD